MRATKQEEVREYLKKHVREALLIKSSEMYDRQQGEVLRAHASGIADYCCWHLTEDYRFLELTDIMGWKRTRSRR